METTYVGVAGSYSPVHSFQNNYAITLRGAHKLLLMGQKQLLSMPFPLSSVSYLLAVLLYA